MDVPNMIHYNGNCHCGRYRFMLSLPEKIGFARSCACRLCTKKAYLWLAPPEGGFQITRDDGELTEYDSGVLLDKVVTYFQRVGQHCAGPLKDAFLVNVRAIQGVNPFEIEIDMTIVNTVYDQPATESSTDTGPPYSFSCHCRSVKAILNVALKDKEVKEDNCSRCVRTGYIGVYPTKEEVHIPDSSWENSFAYAGTYGGGAHHCKTCGVFVFAEVAGPPISVFGGLAPDRREHMLGVYRRKYGLAASER
ncbi:glutathione-dependent formaldehyde-activating gfa protein [Apiospora marii]|uniref:Glutathione-dependent formaldehyde-activating gfa protein n=1 Tax=Apiospora marii TaxID=335849 RepID=A0ABR1SIR9_9PEZI